MSLFPDISLSIAMATFNGANYIDKQLGDILSQSLQPSELVICDDGSTDGTLEKIAEFASKSPFAVHVHRNAARLGYKANFIRAASLCAGDLIAFADQDDLWDARKLAVATRPFANPDVLLVHHNATVVDEGNRPVASLYPERRPEASVSPPTSDPWYYSLGFTQTFRRSLLAMTSYWPLSQDQNSLQERMAHDQWFFFLASVLGVTVYLPDRLVNYRQHGRNTFGWTAPDGPIAKAGRMVGNSSPRYERLAGAAESRASILAVAAREAAAEPWKAQAESGAARYGRLARLLRDRTLIYTSRNPAARARAFRRIFDEGGYHAGAWNLGRHGLAKDLTLGLLGAARAPG